MATVLLFPVRGLAVTHARLAGTAVLLFISFARGAWADEDAPRPGAYSVRGHDSREGDYAGTATIEPGEGGLTLTVERTDGPALSGPLRREGAKWRWEASLSGRGIVEALRGEKSTDAIHRASYALGSAGDLTGDWHRRSGRKVLAHGTETLEPQPESARVHVAVSVDWEGDDLEEANLRAMEAFREALPDVPLTHFLNAAYLTKRGAQAETVAAAIRRTLREGDETGLHVHAWRSLVEAAGATFRTSPTFWGRVYPTPPGRDDGHDVELPAYPVADLRKIVGTSRELLGRAGFPISASFRAGGWMADAAVLEAVRAEGFLVDSSATDPSWHDELAGLPLRTRIAEVWPGVTVASAPFVVKTAAGTILEMPDTGALADYTTATEIEGHLRQALKRAEQDPARDLYVHIGFHQETAGRYASRVIQAVRAVRDAAGERLVFETLEASAAHALESGAAQPGGR